MSELVFFIAILLFGPVLVGLVVATIMIRAWLLPDDYFDPSRDIGI